MSDEKSLPQFARIEQPFGAEPPVVHCPICGQATIDISVPEVTPCEHLSFIYVGEANDFEFKSDIFTEKTDNLDLEDLDFDGFSAFLANVGYGNNMLALEVTYGGMACGPIWFTDIYGFDYSLIEIEN